jgi:hypothetical protein
MKNGFDLEPSAASSQDDFNFLIGPWKIKNEKLRSRLTGTNEWDEFEAAGECRKILTGLGNVDSFVTDKDGEQFEGLTLRLFDPKSRLWSIYWADSNAGRLDVPVVGSFEGGFGKFFARDVYAGTEIIIQFVWDKTEPDSPVWSQAFSADDGRTWEWNWFMYFTKAQGAAAGTAA